MKTKAPSERRGRLASKDFSPAAFLYAVNKLKKQGKVDRTTFTDSIVPGLRAIVRVTGLISYHVQYTVDGNRMYLKIGDHPDTTIAEARILAVIVRALAERGIDPQDGLHKRLIRELRERGAAWKP